MNEGQGQSGQLERIPLSFVMSMYENNTLKNKKVIQKNQKKKQAIKGQNLGIWP